ncbi:uncharacterized protein AB675_8434 [Cyphellophora attinorum]|uniref:Centrosomin N-terminal motif 1 domain-containing protein n=1 Tax=Cyphellophora attinorum TaxID=1664694 RepID=A0A0N1I024_9EURO|nr:uncharacterized protein AB675_8434 [Phialophora attinorum]KPI44632.1 hypothetical protein AB675_8434 [Phialophora attinorum]
MNNARPSPTTSPPAPGFGHPPGPSDAHDTIAPYPSPSSRQQRLLKLRNDNFSAKSSLSGTVLNSRLSGLTAENGSPPQRNQENVVVAHPRVQPRKYHTTSSLGILAEISNSVRSASLGVRQRELLGRQAIPIFQDNPERGLLEPSPTTSPPVYRNSLSSPVDSPFRFEHIQDSFTMGLREVSGNARKSPLTDNPLGTNDSKSIRRRKTTTTSRFNSEEYIDRIEKELELANNSVYSPNSNRSWKDKLKQAEQENERLRQELADVKTTFETEVQTAVQHKTAAELALRRKIRALEDEVEQKNSTIREIQSQRVHEHPDQGMFDTLRATIERLEAENHSLEQSNETLRPRGSAQTIEKPASPVTAATSGGFISHTYTSTTAAQPHRLACVKSCLKLVPIYADWRPTSEQPPASSSVDPSGKPNPNRRRRRMHGSTQLKPLLLPTLTSEYGALSTTTPVVSPSKTPRRDFSEESADPTTMFISQSPASYDFDGESVLSDPYAESASKTTARSLAYQSLEGVLDGSDDTTARDTDAGQSYFGFISNTARAGSSVISPRSGYALDGLRSPRSMSSGEDADSTLMPRYHQSAPGDGPNDGPGQLILYSSPGEVSGVEIPEPLFSTSMRQAAPTDEPMLPSLSAHDDIDNHGLPVLAGYARKRRKMSSAFEAHDESHIDKDNDVAAEAEPTALPETTDRGTDARSLSGTETPMVRSRPTSMSLLSPRRSRTPLELLSRKNFGVKPIAVVTIKTIYGTLSRCTTMMRDFRRDPLAVARRVIANAWRCNWAVLGKLSWWVLGLFLGSSTKDREQDWDWDDFDGEAIADRHCGASSEARQPLLQEQSGDSQERRVHFDADNASAGEHVPSPPQESRKPGWGKTVMLWGKFSMAIMLAVGGAVVKGPGEMLKESDLDSASSRGRKGHRRVSVHNGDDALGDVSATSVELQAVSPDSATSSCRKRRMAKPSLFSPPPSARAVLSQELDMEHFSSSPPASSSPSLGSFRFGRGQRFDFAMDDDLNMDVEVETLKPRRSARSRLDNVFEPSNTTKAFERGKHGHHEYDPASAGLGAFDSTRPLPIA